METTNSATGAETNTGGMTRRQLLLTATAGGASLAITALGGAAVGHLATRAEYEIELTKLRTLVALYEQLEKVGIDAVIGAGLGVMRGALDTVQAGARLLRDGMAAAENALKALQGMLETLRAEADRAAQGLADLMGQFRAAEAVVVAVVGTALPLTESIRNFFNALLDKIPFGIGDNIRRAVDSLVGLIRAIPATVELITGQLLKPLAETFFPPTGTPPVKTSVVDPIAKSLLEPLKTFLGDVDALVTRWQKDFAAPIQSALDERRQVREQIAAYRNENRV